MPTDIWVEFTTKSPTPDQIGEALRNYINESGTIIWNHVCARWFVTLVGTSRRAFPRPGDAEEFGPGFESREFEVYPSLGASEPYVDVMTRFADDFTSIIARGFAEIIARQWNGRIERRQAVPKSKRSVIR